MMYPFLCQKYFTIRKNLGKGIYMALACWVVVILSSSAYPSQGNAVARQFYIQVDALDPEVGTFSIGVFCLDERGRLVEDFAGIRPIQVVITREDGTPLEEKPIVPQDLEFKKGQASFSLSLNKEGIFYMSVDSEDIQTPYPAKVVNSASLIELRLEEVTNEDGRLIVLVFNQKLDDITATQKENYEIFIENRSFFPGRVELQGERVVLELPSACKNNQEIYVKIHNLKAYKHQEAVDITTPTFVCRCPGNCP
jgi:hypothetical protein